MQSALSDIPYIETYIADMLTELIKLANSSNQTYLALPKSLAPHEAEWTARRLKAKVKKSRFKSRSRRA
jgi:hypothetical protein